MTVLHDLRRGFHRALMADLIRLNEKGIPNFADGSSAASSDIARSVITKINGQPGIGVVGSQQSGRIFETVVQEFIGECFDKLNHMRPGEWSLNRNENIALYEQYSHLTDIANAAKRDVQLAAVLGSDYVVKPDIVVRRLPEADETINTNEPLVDGDVARMTPLRMGNQSSPLLHASISCKWTIRSDRSQNSRTEALNLIRNRKGRVPHIVVVTAEPLPSRIASIALGTGDIDCTYHIALPELIEAVEEREGEEALNLIRMMVEGKRLRDIADLPLDLTI